MALTDLALAVSERISSDRLIQLTNPDSKNASTINETKITIAATDTKSKFKILTGVDYDNTNTDHIAFAVEGVIILLMKWAGRETSTVEAMISEWESKLGQFRLTAGGNKRLSPTTDSQLTPTKDKRGRDIIVRPDFDSTRFDNIKPNAPFGSGNDDLDID